MGGHLSESQLNSLNMVILFLQRLFQSSSSLTNIMFGKLKMDEFSCSNQEKIIQMNKLIFLFLATMLLYSCNRKQPDTSLPLPAPINIAPLKKDSTVSIVDTHYYWISDLDQEEGLILKKTTPVPTDSLTVTNMIERMNEAYPEIKLKYARVSNDTIFLKIDKSTYLTQQMGSSGAEAYLAEVTFNLTEVKGINNVDFRFKAGDHATPDTYSRTDFINEVHK